MKTRRSWGLLFALLLTFFITTFNWILRFVKLQKMIEMTLLGLGTDGNMSLSGRRSSFGVWLRSSSSLYYPSIWFFNEIADAGIPFLVNDVLAAWRAAAICRGYVSRVRYIVLRCVLLFLLLVTFTFWVVYSSLRMDPLAAGTSKNSAISAILSITSSSASIASNLLATTIIGHTAWRHLVIPQRSGVDRLHQTSGAMVLLYLTESGAFYAAIQIVRLALSLSVVPSTPVYGSLHTASNIFTYATAIITAMYPPAVILIIRNNLSITDNIDSSKVHSPGADGDNTTLSAIKFERAAKSTRDTPEEFEERSGTVSDEEK